MAIIRRQLAGESLEIVVVQWVIQNVVKIFFETLVAIGRRQLAGE